ncbi:MAG: helix-turn-helix transcriptional regulator [Candidatus Aminicenantaceae bacterium]
MKDLTLTEEMILWAVWKLKANAYGVTIRKQVSERTGRIFPYGTLYGILAKLCRKRFVTKSTSDPSPIRGGRSRNYYTITSQGQAALKAAMELKKTLWDEESELALGAK